MFLIIKKRRIFIYVYIWYGFRYRQVVICTSCTDRCWHTFKAARWILNISEVVRQIHIIICSTSKDRPMMYCTAYSCYEKTCWTLGLSVTYDVLMNNSVIMVDTDRAMDMLARLDWHPSRPLGIELFIHCFLIRLSWQHNCMYSGIFLHS